MALVDLKRSAQDMAELKREDEVAGEIDSVAEEAAEDAENKSVGGQSVMTNSYRGRR